MTTLKIDAKNAVIDDILNEKFLIQNQTGKILSDDQDTCPEHSFTLDTHWKPSNRYQDPDHKLLLGQHQLI